MLWPLSQDLISFNEIFSKSNKNYLFSMPMIINTYSGKITLSALQNKVVVFKMRKYVIWVIYIGGHQFCADSEIINVSMLCEFAVRVSSIQYAIGYCKSLNVESHKSTQQQRNTRKLVFSECYWKNSFVHVGVL